MVFAQKHWGCATLQAKWVKIGLSKKLSVFKLNTVQLLLLELVSTSN